MLFSVVARARQRTYVRAALALVSRDIQRVSTLSSERVRRTTDETPYTQRLSSLKYFLVAGDWELKDYSVEVEDGG